MSDAVPFREGDKAATVEALSDLMYAVGDATEKGVMP